MDSIISMKMYTLETDTTTDIKEATFQCMVFGKVGWMNLDFTMSMFLLFILHLPALSSSPNWNPTQGTLSNFSREGKDNQELLVEWKRWHKKNVVGGGKRPFWSSILIPQCTSPASQKTTSRGKRENFSPNISSLRTGMQEQSAAKPREITASSLLVIICRHVLYEYVQSSFKTTQTSGHHHYWWCAGSQQC